MEQNEIIRRLRRQLIMERAIIALIVLFVLGRLAVANYMNTPYAVHVDGEPVAIVQSKQVAEQVISAVKSDGEAELKENVSIHRIRTEDGILSAPDAEKSLRNAVTPMAEAWVIFINVKPGVALPTEEDASHVLNRARERFGSLVENLMELPTFKEDVTVEPALVEAHLIHTDIEAALDDLVSEAPPKAITASGAGGRQEHIVQSGQVAGQIAQRYGLNLDKLEQLNPGRNLNRLQIGDKLVVGQPSAEPETNGSSVSSQMAEGQRLTVVVRDLVTQTESMPYRTETVSSMQMFEGKQVVLSPGKAGSRRVKRAVTYENGVRTGSEIIEETVLSQPQAERVSVGIRTRR